jgi:formylglycine-generating enzyme required for sulfatase activity/CRP-like cAMP-binding protein/chromosome segregation ATPase
MSAATKYAAKKNLQELVPLNELSESSFKEIAPKILIEEVRSGHYLFHKGDHDNQSVYLLDGKVDLIDGHKKVTGEVEAGTDSSRYPIANQQPRPLSVRAASKVVIARIDSMLIDAFMNWDHTSVAEATEIIADDDEDWMTRILKSEAFAKISPAILQRLIISMEPFPVSAGDVVIRQGDEGDYFYSIDKGRCAVTRREVPDGKDELLSELSSGDFFGEESLLLASTRNATITMMTDGRLMRLGKKAFVELLQKPLVKSVSFKQASSMVEDGAVWIDVRTEEEYTCDAIEDSVNIPLNDLRDQIPELVFNAKYVICCDTGHRSISAAFVLSHKGFEAYVLEGGLNALQADVAVPAHQGRSCAARGLEAPERQGAEIVAFSQNRQATSRDGSDAGAENRLPPERGEASGADQLLELDALRSEIDTLRQADRLRQEAESRLLELQTEVGSQQDVIDQSNRLVETLRAELETETGNKRLLQERHDAALQAHAEQLDRLAQEIEQSTALASRLQAELAVVEQDRQQLQELIGSNEADHDARFSQFEEELSRIRQQRDELQAEFEAGKKQAACVEEEYASYRKEQIGAQESLREDLAQAQRRFESLHAELLQKAQQHSEAETSLQQQLRTVDSLHKELDESRQQFTTLQTELAVERERRQTLDEDVNAELEHRLAELESLRDELAQARRRESELSERIASEENESRIARQQLEERSAGYEQLQIESNQHAEQVQQQLDASLTERQALEERLASLQRDYESLESERGQLLSQQEEQADLVGRLTADKQEAEDALATLREESTAEHAALKEQIEAGGCRLADLESQLEQTAESAARENQQLQEKMQTRIDAHREELESLNREREELQKAESSAREALQALTAERDGLQARLDQAKQEGETQQCRIDELNTMVESLRSAADGHARELGEQLENARHQANEAESRLDAMNTELLARREKEAALLVDIEALKDQGKELQEQLQAAEERHRTRDVENQGALDKLYGELTRKNETERELQGQIERLRKKLGQSEEALQTARHETRESVENIRNELNTERRARADERAEMAARQRELKEQLVSVASQHEEVIASRDGFVAQARNDAREEERTRLGQVIAMQTEMEQQLASLQEELRQAHEETEAAVRRERASNQADLEAAQRQKADADLALDQIETQLKQLMEERDAALAERQSAHEQLNFLRAEVEVARGQVNADQQGLADDPIRLIAELKETRRNIEIAIRLRSEAETQRDQAIAQLEALRHAWPEAESSNNRLVVASQTEVGSGSAAVGTGSVAPTVTKADRVRWIKAWLGILGVAVIAAFAFWFAERFEFPGLGKLSPADSSVDAVPAAVSPVTPESKPTAARHPAVSRSTSPATPSRGAVTPATRSSTESPPVPARKKQAASGLAPVRSFRDTLVDGGSGPLMVELPAADYLMGSAGNSLNFEERPQHRVELRGFSIGKDEVSFAEYDRFAKATGRQLPHDEGWGRGDRPVINISWKDAVAYANWLSEQTGHHYRLPSESEWEFAARGDTTSAFWWEGVMRKNPANCFDCGSRWDSSSTAPVGSFQGNKFGIHDTSGNVQEWMEDCYHPNYQNAPSDGSAWESPGCTLRTVRGGSYTSPLDSVRSAKRGQYEQNTRLDNLGFRVVRVD